MALQEFVGAVVMEIDGREIDIVSISPSTSTGRRLVKTMNKTGRPAGFSRGVEERSLSVSAVVPVDGDPVDWEGIEGAKITITPIGGGRRVSYLDCFSVTVGEQYSVDNEARIDIQMMGLRKVEE